MCKVFRHTAVWRHHKNVRSRSTFICIPMSIEQPLKDNRFYFRIFDFLVLSFITCQLIRGRAVALRINIRCKRYMFPVRRPKLAASLGRNRSQLMHRADSSRRPIELRNPNLRSTFLIRDKRKPLPIRSPPRTIPILIGNQNSLSRCHPDRSRRIRRILLRSGGTPTPFRTAAQRHDPYMRRLGIRRQIHIHHAEQNPLPIRRRHRLADALQLHHVFKGKGMFALSGDRHYKKCSEEERNRNVSKQANAHDSLRRKRCREDPIVYRRKGS